MARREESSKTTTTEALLGLLSLKPMSGYEIRQMVNSSIGNFWAESYGQIYPSLRKMVADGLADCRQEQERGRLPKKIYTLTERGRARLCEWLRMPVMKQVPRNELLLKTFFAAEGDVRDLRAKLEAQRAKLAEDVVRYEATVTRISKEHAGNPGLKFWLMTTRYGLMEANFVTAWCDECLKALVVEGSINPVSEPIAEPT